MPPMVRALQLGATRIGRDDEPGSYSIQVGAELFGWGGPSAGPVQAAAWWGGRRVPTNKPEPLAAQVWRELGGGEARGPDAKRAGIRRGTRPGVVPPGAKPCLGWTSGSSRGDRRAGCPPAQRSPKGMAEGQRDPPRAMCSVALQSDTQWGRKCVGGKEFSQEYDPAHATCPTSPSAAWSDRFSDMPLQDDSGLSKGGAIRSMKKLHRIRRLDRQEHAARALLMIANWGWLRATELGRLMHPGDQFSRKYAEKYCRKLREMKLVIPRPLPGHHAGNAYVVSAQGASQLNSWAGERRYSSNKDWGESCDGRWFPPATWQHDLIAAGVLSKLAEDRGYEVVPELALRRLDQTTLKHPDGIAIDIQSGLSIWLEVEGARKSGKNMNALVRALVKASRGEPTVTYDFLQHAPIRLGMVAIDPSARDERGHRIDHWSRIQAAVRKAGLAAPVAICLVNFTKSGVGVGDIRFEMKHLNP